MSESEVVLRMIKKNEKLTSKSELFVQELIKGRSQREAYKTAYSTENMKDKTIDEKASRLFAEDKVRARYYELQDRLRKEAEDECIITAKEVLKELVKIGFADIGDYLQYRTAKTVIKYDGDEPIIDYRSIVDLKESKDVDTSAIQEVSINSRGVFTFKLYDKMAALEKIGKHLGMYREKIEVSGEDGGPIVQFYLPKNGRDRELDANVERMAVKLDG